MHLGRFSMAHHGSLACGALHDKVICTAAAASRQALIFAPPLISIITSSQNSCRMIDELVIDSMQANDWERVRAIYLEGIATGHATFETGAPRYEQWDQAHLPFARLIARQGDTILGWAALSPVSQRCVYG